MSKDVGVRKGHDLAEGSAASGHRPRLLDLFCGAGGCSVGYERAGFEVVGVDIAHQPRYPFAFSRNDALDVLRSMLDYPTASGIWWNPGYFDAIHASPPCQAYGMLRSLNPTKIYPDLIPETRELLEATGLPFVIENVVGAPLRDPVMLCGSSAGLRVRRHRLFESNVPLIVPGCAHGLERPEFPVGLGSPINAIRKRRGEVVLSKVAFVYGSTRYAGDLADRKRAMGIDWMTNRELTQAIPPAYTELIGAQLLAHVRKPVAA